MIISALNNPKKVAIKPTNYIKRLKSFLRQETFLYTNKIANRFNKIINSSVYLLINEAKFLAPKMCFHQALHVMKSPKLLAMQANKNISSTSNDIKRKHLNSYTFKTTLI